MLKNSSKTLNVLGKAVAELQTGSPSMEELIKQLVQENVQQQQSSAQQQTAHMETAHMEAMQAQQETNQLLIKQISALTESLSELRKV